MHAAQLQEPSIAPQPHIQRAVDALPLRAARLAQLESKLSQVLGGGTRDGAAAARWQVACRLRGRRSTEPFSPCYRRTPCRQRPVRAAQASPMGDEEAETMLACVVSAALPRRPEREPESEADSSSSASKNVSSPAVQGAVQGQHSAVHGERRHSQPQPHRRNPPQQLCSCAAGQRESGSVSPNASAPALLDARKRFGGQRAPTSRSSICSDPSAVCTAVCQGEGGR